MNTFKKTTLFIISVLLIMLSSMAVIAEADRVVDGAMLLTAEEAQTLRTKLDEISIQYQCDVAIVTTDSEDINSEYDAMVYADDFFDYNGYGIGSGKDGIILLISINDNGRFYWFSAHGYGSTAFSDNDTENMGEQIVPYLKDGDYYSAFMLYAEMAEDLLEYARNGTVNEGTNNEGSFEYTEPDNVSEGISTWYFAFDAKRLLIALAIGVVISFIATWIMRMKLKSVKMQSGAGNYVRDGSMNIVNSRDTFLYSHVDRTEIPQDDDNNGSSHISSSGETHTGSGGSF